MVWVSRAVPNFLATVAGIFSSKKNQTWEPFPDLERSTAMGIFNSRQTALNAETSFFHSSLSKSTAKKKQVSSWQRVNSDDCLAPEMTVNDSPGKRGV